MPPSAVLATLTHIWPRLESSGISVAIAGGIALSYWGNPRSTQDVDLAIYASHFDSLRTILVEAGLRAKDPHEKDLGLFHLNQFEFDPPDAFVTVEIDLMVSDSDYYSQAAMRFVPVQLAGISMPVSVLSREDLILHKLYSNRLIDQADVQNLLEMHGNKLDRSYLDHWSRLLEIHESLRQSIERTEQP